MNRPNCSPRRFTPLLLSVLVVAGFLYANATLQAEADKEIQATKQNSSECRIIVNWDELNMWAYQMKWAQSLQKKPLDPEEVKALVEHVVDEHAKAKVDRLVHCLFSLPWGTCESGFKTFYRAPSRGWMTAIKKIAPAMVGFDNKYDLIQVSLDRSHKNGMQFLAGFRMNDRHPNSTKQSFYQDHPQWRLGLNSGGVDYKHAGVRKAMLAIIEETLARYDVDGIELDWMRHCHVFKSSEAENNAPLLTEFTLKIRKLLDEAAKRRGRDRLLLGVRIPQTMEECKSLGFDVKAWVQNRSVDYICPSDFHFLDMNIKVEEFVELTRGTNCKVFPTATAALGIGNNRRGISHKNFRAVAHNFYAFGAQGISTYNYYNQYRSLPGNEWGKASAEFKLANWPRALAYLTEIRDPKVVARGDKHYLYHPIWPTGGCPTGAEKRGGIFEVNRNSPAQKSSIRLRIADDFNSSDVTATLEFKATGMVEADVLEISLNGKIVPAENIQRTFDADGQSKKEGRVLTPFFLYQIKLAHPAAQRGDNQLSVRLATSNGTENPVIQEFETYVRYAK